MVGVQNKLGFGAGTHGGGGSGGESTRMVLSAVFLLRCSLFCVRRGGALRLAGAGRGEVRGDGASWRHAATSRMIYTPNNRANLPNVSRVLASSMAPLCEGHF